LAAWNEDLECFQTVCKCGTGFSDELFTKLKPQFEEIIINKPAKSLKIKDNMP
jgi:ATP-dependent DNA ligase